MMSEKIFGIIFYNIRLDMTTDNGGRLVRLVFYML